jgi:cysteine desulfurase/selenocysteine lyase
VAWERIRELAARLRARLAELPGVMVGDRGEVLGAIVTFVVQGRAAGDVQRALAEQRINVSVSEASSARLDFGPRGIDELVRSSVHYYNTDDEVDRLVECVAALA